MTPIIHGGTRQFLSVSRHKDTQMFRLVSYRGKYKDWEVYVEESRLKVHDEIFQAQHPLNVPYKLYKPQELK